MPEDNGPLPPVAESRAVAKGHTRISLVWVIPLIAAAAGAWVAIARVMSEGPVITITFNSAEGIEAGKTKIQYKGVEVGTLTKIRLSGDHQRVIATAQMEPRTEGFLVEDTEFWVVRPRISGANVTGLGTLISGAYIGMEIGASRIEKRDFVALGAEPIVTGGSAGRFFDLKASDLGSLDNGTPIFFRRLQVGQVSSYKLDPDGQHFTVRIFVKTPYDHYVTPYTRFWQASGVDVSLTANGLSVQTQSLLSILIGGVAFETPPHGPNLRPADPDTAFTLFDTRAQAFELPVQNPQTFELIFNESVRGLSPGAPVEFRGIRVGEVADIRAEIDLKNSQFLVPVIIRLEPRRLGVKIVETTSDANLEILRRRFFDSLISHGVRAQLRTGNLLTGQAYVAFDFFPNAKPATVDWSQNPVQLPTVQGELEATEAGLVEIVQKINKMPLQQIGDRLHQTLIDLDQALVTARGTLLTANGTLISARGTLNSAENMVRPNSVQNQNLDHTLQELSRAAQSVRVLADYLEQHPEALIRGKPGEAK
jgi:paraquat-inducible protein B